MGGCLEGKAIFSPEVSALYVQRTSQKLDQEWLKAVASGVHQFIIIIIYPLRNGKSILAIITIKMNDQLISQTNVK